MPDLSSLLGSLGGGGAGGGTPDIASLLSNPAIMQMANQLAANGGLDSLMSNPAVADMVSSSPQPGDVHILTPYNRQTGSGVATVLQWRR
jgi:small glutamine-rich tetratricopeptide repeat-containing protein alpha